MSGGKIKRRLKSDKVVLLLLVFSIVPPISLLF